MLTDMSSKSLFTTFNEETRSSCSCGNYDRTLLREKLQEILSCLYEEISAKQRYIENLQKAHSEAIKEKEEIIERLASANSKLVMENQLLLKRVAKNQIYNKTILQEVQSKFNAKIKEKDQKVQYLEQRNQYLKRQIIAALSFIPQQLLSKPHKPSSPHSRYSGQSSNPPTHETRYSQLSYHSPVKRMPANVSPPSKYSIFVHEASRRKEIFNSQIMESREIYEKKRARSSIAKELEVGS